MEKYIYFESMIGDLTDVNVSQSHIFGLIHSCSLLNGVVAVFLENREMWEFSAFRVSTDDEESVHFKAN